MSAAFVMPEPGSRRWIDAPEATTSAATAPAKPAKKTPAKTRAPRTDARAPRTEEPARPAACPPTVSGGPAPRHAVPPPPPATIPPSVHIGSKGCAEAYTNTVRRERGACACPDGACWVTYARAEHARGRDALDIAEWAEAGAPMPPPHALRVRRAKGRTA